MKTRQEKDPVIQGESPGRAASTEKTPEAQLREIIDEAGTAFFETDIHGRLTEFSRSLCAVLGQPREAIEGREFAHFMEGEQARKFRKAMDKTWVTHRGFSNLLWPIRDHTGNQRIMELSAYLIRDHEGEKSGFRGIARDVTQEFATATALREAERRYKQEFDKGMKAKKRTKNLLDFVPYPMVAFTSTGNVTYINPAFTEVFGWSLKEVVGRTIPFVPPELKEQTLRDLKRLLKEKDDTIETKRLTKDGRMLDVMIRGQISSEEEDDSYGELFILRDITEERRLERTNEALFQISSALPRYPRLEDLLDYISGEVRRLLNTEGAVVGLLDEKKGDIHFLGAAYDDSSALRQVKTKRHPFEGSISGRAIRTGHPIVVPDPHRDPDFHDGLDQAIGFESRNFVVVPLEGREKIVGVLIAVNKKEGVFDPNDTKLLTMIASTVALSIENARFSEDLKRAYEEVSGLNRAKDRIINHLSHELRTPASVVLASINMLSRKLEAFPAEEWKPTLARARRNLERILEIQYQVGDIMRDPEYKTHSMLSLLLDQCMDELEALVAEKTGEGGIVQWLRQRIEEDFGPKESPPEAIKVDEFVKSRIGVLKDNFSHRKIHIHTRLETSPPVCLPVQVLEKVVDGLIRNAVENTPDEGKIMVYVREKGEGVELMVEDFGVGISGEDQKRIFEGFFPTQETLLYSSKRPFDFNAGGKGADLLRMRVFAERYHFKLDMESTRCRFIPQKGDPCPGNIHDCRFCQQVSDCYGSGGTTFTLFFIRAPEAGCQDGNSGSH
ncbi:MAG: PAS domain S-box protein [Desulfatiglandaceae bacterium]